MKMKAIGRVKSKHKKPADIKAACREGLRYRERSTIVLDRKLATGMEDLKRFSHAWVIFHLDRNNKIKTKDYPKSPEESEEVGVYASRSPCRTNHIGLRLVRIISIDRNELLVEGLDAIDRSPVLDIKPFVPRFDMPERKEVRTAEWYDDR
jgi:tRNA-Thr(GGU) m(6)t(6)A37 methyltransferase TsaA